MSPSTATARATRPAPTIPVRRTTSLRLVPQRRSTAAKAPFVAAVVSLLVVGLLGLLLLNTLVAQQSFRLHDLAKQGKVLDQQEQELLTAVQVQGAPAFLAKRATALGMVPAGPPLFLRLSDGKVLGAMPTTREQRRQARSAATRRPVAPPAAAGTKPATTKPATADPGSAKPAAGGTKPIAAKPATAKPIAVKPGTVRPGSPLPSLPTPPAHRSRP